MGKLTIKLWNYVLKGKKIWTKLYIGAATSGVGFRCRILLIRDCEGESRQVWNTEPKWDAVIWPLRCSNHNKDWDCRMVDCAKYLASSLVTASFDWNTFCHQLIMWHLGILQIIQGYEAALGHLVVLAWKAESWLRQQLRLLIPTAEFLQWKPFAFMGWRLNALLLWTGFTLFLTFLIMFWSHKIDVNHSSRLVHE